MKSKNVVVILADQFRKDCIGAYGNPYVSTPNMDRLAAMSVVCSRSYVTNPICSPNRNTIFSGIYPSNHGVYTNGVMEKDKGRTIMYELKKAGYQTASIGKIHFSPCGKESKDVSFESVGNWMETPSEPAYTGGYFGFDHVELTVGHGVPRAHYKRWFLEHGGTEDMLKVDYFEGACGAKEKCGVRRMPSRLSSSAFIGDRSVNYLKEYRNPDQPFFMSVSFPDPHFPFTSCYDDYARWKDQPVAPSIGSEKDLTSRPEHFLRHFNGEWSRKGIGPARYVSGVPEAVAQERKRHTYAMIEAIDRSIGLLLDELERQHLMEETIIVLASDHGELLGDHGLWLKGPFLYDGLINTPLMIYHPDMKAGRCDDLISAVDITPTLLHMLNRPIPAYVDGRSIYCAETGEIHSSRESCLVEYRNGYDCDVNVNGIVTRDEKYIAYENGEEEYTDLRKDPDECRSLAHDPAFDKQKLEMARKLLQLKIEAKPKGTAQYGNS